MKIGMHTVVILVGPSQSGKSTWANLLKEKIESIDSELRTIILSSDNIRRSLLGFDYNRYDKKMNEASEAAFDLLFAHLKAAIRFPINNEFVIVDSTGLDNNFRIQVSELASENGYRTAVVDFDYATGDYFKGLSSQDKNIVGYHVDIFKKRTLPGIKRKNFDYNFTVKAKNKKYFEEIVIDIVDYQLWRKSHITLDNTRPLAIIGDVHEHVEALHSLIKKLPENCQLVFLGDLIDKGNQTKEIIEYMKQFPEAILVKGNHEEFVARRLLGEIDAIDKEDELFPSFKVLKENQELREQFLEIYNRMLPFLCVKAYGKTIYITHAPCFNKSLGKLDESNQKFQRNFYFSSRDSDSMLNELDFIEKEAKNSHPYHVFGHVAHGMKTIQVKNKVWLDTGAVYGGKLSAFYVSPNGDAKIISQDAKKLNEGKLLYFSKKLLSLDNEMEEAKKRLVERSANKIARTSEMINSFKNLPEISGDLDKAQTEDIIISLSAKYKLTPEDKYWLYSFKESQAKFISGTMSPSKATKEKLEPVSTALDYYNSKNIEEVILQPKYMGSRMQFYLHRDNSKDFAITRSGKKTNHNLKEVFSSWHQKLDGENFWKEQIILDGELLPWSAIGRELIDKEFVQYGMSIDKEMTLLSEDQTFKNFNTGFEIVEHKKSIDIFLEQIALYGQNSPLEYKPFSILAVDNISWVEKNQLEVFEKLLPNEPYLVVNTKNIEGAEKYFDSLTNELKYEGMVVKPLVYIRKVAPYMKVRNENYLHIIYGYDYKFKYAKMVANKRIDRKLELSIKEYEIGQKMLATKSQKDLLELACQMKFQINFEKDLDSRL